MLLGGDIADEELGADHDTIGPVAVAAGARRPLLRAASPVKSNVVELSSNWHATATFERGVQARSERILGRSPALIQRHCCQVGPETATGSVRSKSLSRTHSLLTGLFETQMDDNIRGSSWFCKDVPTITRP
jgi:hypothetical protein